MKRFFTLSMGIILGACVYLGCDSAPKDPQTLRAELESELKSGLGIVVKMAGSGNITPQEAERIATCTARDIVKGLSDEEIRMLKESSLSERMSNGQTMNALMAKIGPDSAYTGRILHQCMAATR